MNTLVRSMLALAAAATLAVSGMAPAHGAESTVHGGVVAAATTALAAHGLCRNVMRVSAQMLGYPECR